VRWVKKGGESGGIKERGDTNWEEGSGEEESKRVLSGEDVRRTALGRQSFVGGSGREGGEAGRGRG